MNQSSFFILSILHKKNDQGKFSMSHEPRYSKVN